jgi:UDP-N-acetylglucosamine 2-epimerase (non-hydrolysing)
MVGWVMDVFWWTVRNARSIRRSLPGGSLVVVHGDTVTTVLGSLIGKRLGVPVAHVEAGLRSGDWRNPFPEELDRRIVGRIADIHYVPSHEAAANLDGRPNVVVTHGNTAKDAVRDVVGAVKPPFEGDAEPYGLVLLHRYEFISNPALVRETLRNLESNSLLPLRIIVDSYSSSAIALVIEELGFEKFTLMTKLEHSEFVAAMSAADFIVTDSGGIQQEAAALGVPTLIHRKVTEGREGFGATAVLSGWDQAVLTEFLSGYTKYRRADIVKDDSPSDIIVGDLLERGFAVPAETARSRDPRG